MQCNDVHYNAMYTCLCQNNSDNMPKHESKVRKGAKIRNPYNQTTWPRTLYGRVTKTQENIIQESEEVNPFPAGVHKAAKNRQSK